MRKYLIGAAGLVATAMALMVPTATAEAHAPYAACRPHVYHRNYYRACPPVIRGCRHGVIWPRTCVPVWHHRHCR